VGWGDVLLVRWRAAQGVDLAAEPARGVVLGILRGFEPRGMRLEGCSLGRGELWLTVRGRSRRALASGMKALAVRLARHVNRRLRRAGKLFPERYVEWPVAELGRGRADLPAARVLVRSIRPLPAA
jgi:hypothetical protein